MNRTRRRRKKTKRKEREERDDENYGRIKLVHTIEYDINKGEENMDPYKGMINRGCSKTVAGRAWMDTFTESKDSNVKIRIRKENEMFRFCSSDIYALGENYEIER